MTAQPCPRCGHIDCDGCGDQERYFDEARVCTECGWWPVLAHCHSCGTTYRSVREGGPTVSAITGTNSVTVKKVVSVVASEAQVEVRNEVAQAVMEGIMAAGMEVTDSDNARVGPLGGTSCTVEGELNGQRFIVSIYCDEKTQKDDNT